MSEFEKPVSSADMYFIALNELRPPSVIQLVIEGEGEPRLSSLGRALALTSEVNPGSRLILDERPSPRWVLGPSPTLTEVEIPDFDPCRGEGSSLWSRPLDAKSGPSSEVVVVRSAHTTRLVFRALHAVMDGQGTLLWAKDFMRALRGESPVGHPSAITVDQVLSELALSNRPGPLGDAAPLIESQRTTARDPQSQVTGEFRWRRITTARRLEPNVTGRLALALRDFAHEKRAADEPERMDGHATRRMEGSTRLVRIGLPTDLRRHRPEERTTGNMFGALFLEVAPSATVEATTLEVVRMLYTKEGARTLGLYSRPGPGSLAAVRVKVFWDLIHLGRNGRNAVSATLSHLGRIISDEMSAPSFRATSAYFVPLRSPIGCVVHVIGFDEHIETTVGIACDVDRRDHTELRLESSGRVGGDGDPLLSLAHVLGRAVSA